MTEESERLKRIAYGPDATAQERAAAETALRQLGDAGVASAADIRNATAEGYQPVDAGGDAGAPPADNVDAVGDDEQETEPSFWGQSIRVAWLIPIVVGALAVGYLASPGSLDAMGGAQNTSGTGSPTPSASTSGEQDVNLHLGDLDAADSWFERPYSESDVFPDANALESYGISVGDVRIAAGASDNVGVWVARTGDSLCLIIANSIEGSSASACPERDRFARTGIRLFSSGFGSATWFGREVTTDPLLDAAAGAPSVPVSGPGSLAAANAWFDSAAPSSGQPPAPLMLKHMMGEDPTAVSFYRPENAPWVEVWLAKQSSDGFCIVASDDHGDTGFGNCAAVDEFQMRGLELTAFGFSMFWDGTSLSAVEVSAAGR